MSKTTWNANWDHSPFDAAGETLMSESGRVRRDAMLAPLQQTVVLEGRRRRVRRVAIRSCSLVVLGLAVALGVMRSRTIDHKAAPVIRVYHNPGAFNFHIAQAIPADLSRMIARPTGNLDRYCTDDQGLVKSLAAIGRPAGLIRTDGQVRLTAAVTDPIELPQPNDRRGEAASTVHSGSTG